MPYSEIAGKQFTKDFFQFINPKYILDVGVGCGTYSLLLRNSNIQHWTGIEVWEPYVQKFNLQTHYDELIVEDIRLWEPKTLFNVAFFGDVLEHMTLDESKTVLNKVRRICDYSIISIPFGNNPQEEVENNPFERHIENYWDDVKVRNNFGTPILFNIERGEWCTMGVYVYPKTFM